MFFFSVTATTEIYTYLHTLSLHDALPICRFILVAFNCPSPFAHAAIRPALPSLSLHALPACRPPCPLSLQSAIHAPVRQVCRALRQCPVHVPCVSLPANNLPPARAMPCSIRRPACRYRAVRPDRSA